jgi:hypothetical protein
MRCASASMARAFEPHYMERARPNGRWISVEGAPLPQGGWVTVYTDITEIKYQERLRARAEELSEQLLADSRGWPRPTARWPPRTPRWRRPSAN